MFFFIPWRAALCGPIMLETVLPRPQFAELCLFAGWALCMSTVLTVLNAVGPENFINLLPDSIKVGMPDKARDAESHSKHGLVLAANILL